MAKREMGPGVSRPVALLAGASGLVGGEVLKLLSADGSYGRVVLLVRRKLPSAGERVVQTVVDFSRLEPGHVAGASDVFCCLGTTIRKAGSEEAFRAVDFDMVVSLARLAAGAGARHFLLVSSMGASATSPVFYSRVKGEVEEAVKALPLPGVSIFRPSFLSGERSESRPAERLGIAAAELLSLVPFDAVRRYRPVPAAAVAGAMVRVAHEGPKGVQIIESSRIHELGTDSR